ncbi:MAG: hypothetical protein ACTSRE_03110 [Promethearchaeota archaeon]
MNEIEAVIDVFEKQIQALYTNDFVKFLSFMTPRIQKELTIDNFQKAIGLYKRTSIDINAIDHEKSKFYNEGESEEILDKHVKLVLVHSGRTLCHVVNYDGTWLIDDIYWRINDSEELEEKDDESEVSSGSISEPDSTSEVATDDSEIHPIEEIEKPADNEDHSEEPMTEIDEPIDNSTDDEEEPADEEHS